MNAPTPITDAVRERRGDYLTAVEELERRNAELAQALQDLQKEVRSAVRFDVKKHYSLMVADVCATKALIKNGTA